MANNHIAIAGFTALSVLFGAFHAHAQQSGLGGQVGPTSSGVPFLTISPDARSGAMGDVGIALSPDANAQHWNVGKLAMSNKDMGLSLTYTPWLSQLTPDMFVGYISGYKKLGDKKDQAISASFRYFNLGEINYTNIDATPAGSGKPNELAVDLGYSRKFSDYLSLGVALRYIHSNITQGAQTGQSYKPANAVAGDIGLYYSKTKEESEETSSTFSVGAVLKNIGSRVTYSNNKRDFLPTQLGIGAAYSYKMDAFNRITGSLDLRKTLVPGVITYPDGSYSDPRDKYSVVSGVLNSFVDAPGGYGTNISLGGEYWYQDMFAVRAGYFYEHPDNGARQYFTCGIGVKYMVFGLNFSYLVPAIIHSNDITQKMVTNPLANTFRFSLTFDFNEGEKLSKN
jgi:hypothetical protein